MTQILNEESVRACFVLAGINVMKVKALADGYSYNPSDSRYFERPPRCCWWFVKTEYGWIEIGNRKRVIHIDWSDTEQWGIVTEDDVTKDTTYVHAYSVEDVIKYLRTLNARFEEMKDPDSTCWRAEYANQSN